MTVRDLIAKLSAMPPDAVVVTEMFGEWENLADDQPTLIRAEDRKLIRRHPAGFEGGQYISWKESYKKPGNPDPEFVTVCYFPGN